MAWSSNGTSAAFGAGVNHLLNSGRANAGSITLGGGLQADADRWSSMTLRGVLRTATGDSPADTDAAVEFGQQAVGNHDDAEQAGQSWDRALMRTAAGIGSNDDVS